MSGEHSEMSAEERCDKQQNRSGLSWSGKRSQTYQGPKDTAGYQGPRGPGGYEGPRGPAGYQGPRDTKNTPFLIGNAQKRVISEWKRIISEWKRIKAHDF